jgi:hypothetical protein
MAVAEAVIPGIEESNPTIISISKPLFEVETHTSSRRVVDFVETAPPSRARYYGLQLAMQAERFRHWIYSDWHRDQTQPFQPPFEQLLNSGARLAIQVAQYGLDHLQWTIFDNVRIGSYALDPQTGRITKLRSNLAVVESYVPEVHRNVIERKITIWDEDLQDPSMLTIEAIAKHRRETRDSPFSDRDDDPVDKDEYAQTLQYVQDIAHVYGEQTDPNTHALQLVVDTDPYVVSARQLDCIPLTSALYWSIIKTLADLTKEQDVITIPLHITTLGRRQHFRLQVKREILPQLLMYACVNSMDDNETLLGMTKIPIDLLALEKSGHLSEATEHIIHDTFDTYAMLNHSI